MEEVGDLIHRRRCPQWLVGTLGAFILAAMPGCATSSPASTTSPAQNASSVVAPCNRLATEDLTISGLSDLPMGFKEGIGFDVGLNHYDLWFGLTWYDYPPFPKVAVPGTGVTGTSYDKHGGTATVDMSGGLKAASRSTMGWTAKSGAITFDSTVIYAGGGTVDMEMQPGGGGAGPVHISGTWNAEQPCTVN